MDFEVAKAVTDRHTDTQDNYSNPAAHVRRGLITLDDVEIPVCYLQLFCQEFEKL